MLSSILYIVLSFIEVVIGLRFVLELLGANPSSAFVTWIYNWSMPFVAPFAGIFGQSSSAVGQGTATTSVFDWTALIALVVYGIIGYFIVRSPHLIAHR